MFETPRLKYKIITHDDFDDVFTTLNNEHTCAIVSFFDWPLTNQHVKQWCNRAEKGHADKSEYLFLAYHNDEPAGYIGLHLEEPDKQAQIGYWVTDSFQSQGFATEMIEGVAKLAFEKFGIQDIYATADINNTGSHKVLLKNGFTEAGAKDIPLPNGTMRPSKLFTKRHQGTHATD